jgi:hypothetical protein
MSRAKGAGSWFTDVLKEKIENLNKDTDYYRNHFKKNLDELVEEHKKLGMMKMPDPPKLSVDIVELPLKPLSDTSLNANLIHNIFALLMKQSEFVTYIKSHKTWQPCFRSLYMFIREEKADDLKHLPPIDDWCVELDLYLNSYYDQLRTQPVINERTAEPRYPRLIPKSVEFTNKYQAVVQDQLDQARAIVAKMPTRPTVNVLSKGQFVKPFENNIERPVNHQRLGILQSDKQTHVLSALTLEKRDDLRGVSEIVNNVKQETLMTAIVSLVEKLDTNYCAGILGTLETYNKCARCRAYESYYDLQMAGISKEPVFSADVKNRMLVLMWNLGRPKRLENEQLNTNFEHYNFEWPQEFIVYTRETSGRSVNVQQLEALKTYYYLLYRFIYQAKHKMEIPTTTHIEGTDVQKPTPEALFDLFTMYQTGDMIDLEGIDLLIRQHRFVTLDERVNTIVEQFMKADGAVSQPQFSYEQILQTLLQGLITELGQILELGSPIATQFVEYFIHYLIFDQWLLNDVTEEDVTRMLSHRIEMKIKSMPKKSKRGTQHRFPDGISRIGGCSKYRCRRDNPRGT